MEAREFTGEVASAKKVLPLCLLQIFRRYSDADHVLLMRDILGKLVADYGMAVERKAVTRNIQWLKDFGYDISTYEENGRGFYLREREFEDAELQYLIYGVLSSPYITSSNAKHLIDKIKRFSTIYFEKQMSYIHTVNYWSRSTNRELFYTIDQIGEATSRKRQISFVFNQYDMDKKLHPKHPERYVVNPYQIVSMNGKLYVVCNHVGCDNLTHYRIDFITKIRIEDTPIVRSKQLNDYSVGMNIVDYAKLAIHLGGDTWTPITLRIKPHLVSRVVDCFGKDVVFKRIDEDNIEVSFLSSIQKMRTWAVKYVSACEVLSPLSLRKLIREDAENIMKKYAAGEA